MLEKVRAWYVKYPLACAVGYVGGQIYPLASWVPAWVMELGAKFFGG